MPVAPEAEGAEGGEHSDQEHRGRAQDLHKQPSAGLPKADTAQRGMHLQEDGEQERRGQRPPDSALSVSYMKALGKYIRSQYAFVLYYIF